MFFGSSSMAQYPLYICIQIYMYLFPGRSLSLSHIYIYIYIYKILKSVGPRRDLYLFCSYIYVMCFQLFTFIREYMWHKALLIGYSMRLELTLVSSLNDLQLVRWVLCGLFPLFPRVCLLWSALPVFYISYVYSCVCVCVCVCVCRGFFPRERLMSVW